MDKKVKMSLENVLMGDISAVFNKFVENASIFNFSFEQLAKHFLNEFLDINTFQVSFQELVKEYLININYEESKKSILKKELNELFGNVDEELEKAIQTESLFYKYICKKYLEIIKEPRTELLDLFMKASNDLRTIDETLSDIHLNREKVVKENIAHDVQEKLPILFHYKELNEKAKEEILYFLKYDIKNFALENSMDTFLRQYFFLRSPYNFNENHKAYKPQRPNDLANKFGDLPLPIFNKLYKKYKNTDQTDFNKDLSDFIKDGEIVSRIMDLVDKNHILFERKEIVKEALNIYESGKKIMFANAVPTIIEGVFHDLCIVCGESNNDLLSFGFQEKLNRLKKILSWELHYEYYSFKFRIIRNTVAHGRLAINEINQLSDLLLLDLHQVSQLVSSNRVKLNKKILIVKEFTNGLKEFDYKKICKYILLEDIDIPLFYKLNSNIKRIERVIKSQEFWDYLNKEFENAYESEKHGIYYVVKKLGNRKPFDVRCTTFFQKTKFQSYDLKKALYYVNSLIED
ncbi:hypothetical protein [Flavobacterium sp. WG21]|uniref:hypothetical protein n=1 Tax=Flavobacterium sp. WG21 TaxID=1229487 RepID=UPI000344A2F5|nr:hypothetical protein [Flavobacterium sp. WG21]